MQIYDYNSDLHKYKEVHDETGGRLKELTFQYYDCICGCADNRIVSTTTRHHNQFNIVQCTKCGTLRLNPYMSDSAIETYYKEIYGPIKRKNMTAEALFERQSRSADHIFGIVAPLIQKDSAVLDYGSGAGGRMAKFREENYPNVHLFDYDKKYLDHGVSKGFKAHAQGNRYDMVTLSHVLEHVNHPVEFLQMLAKDYLKPNGMIYIEVPMFEQHLKLIGDFHLAHKFYFTAASLLILAKLAGFKKVAEDEDVLVITPDNAGAQVSEKEYQEALRISDRSLKAADKRTRTISRRVALKKLFKA